MNKDFFSSIGPITNAGGEVLSSVGRAAKSLATLTDPSTLRLSVANLLLGGASAAAKGTAAVSFNQSTAQGKAVPIEQDWRVRVSLAVNSKIMYKDANNAGILAPLAETQGVVFPYTPQITTGFTSNYMPQKLTHSNYSSYFYDGSEVSAINITGDFTVQNHDEGRYLMAAIQFFRSASKMFFGNSELAGQPPPILFLDGYGSHYFPHVSCVLTSFQHTMEGGVDYIEVPLGQLGAGPTTRLPTTSQIQLTLQPVFSRTNVHNNFTLEAFARGDLIAGKGGFI